MQTRRGTMPTDRAARYAKQLMSHWSARGPVTEEDGTILQMWDDGRVIRLTPGDDALGLEVRVPDGEDADAFAGVVQRHLERFGTREELSVSWYPEDT